jgi:hypothetical protein
MLIRFTVPYARALLLLIACCVFAPSMAPSATAACTIPMKECLCAAGDISCSQPLATAVASDQATPIPGSPGNGPEAPTEQAYEAGIPIEELSLYKTLSYVTGATITDQLWYLAIASEAATTGGLFLGINAATSSMMTYSYEYMWNLCCLSPPGPDGVVPVSATKAVIYRGLSIIRVCALALLFGNTVASSSVVTGAITLSRTAVYVANDYFWNGINVREPTEAAPDSVPTALSVKFGPLSVD